MSVDLQTIYGFGLGVEIMDKEVCQILEMNWGFTVDAGIFRLLFSSYKDEG